MTTLHFTVPPLPEYIISGLCEAPSAGKQPNRKNLGIFDLLVVISGQLDVMENGEPYQVESGMYLILRPDAHHYGTKDCSADTTYYWLHFRTSGEWSIDKSQMYHREDAIELKFMIPNYFTVEIPQFGRLTQMQRTVEILEMLTGLVQNGHQTKALWNQQVLFQELIQLLAATGAHPSNSPSSVCAEKAASYLRAHYRDEFKAHTMGLSINFHPVYIARCMQKEYGCSPVEYLQRYRIEQAKLLLVQTDYSISRVAEEVGFNQAAYFTSCFTKQEKVSPRKYRQQFFMD